MRRPAEQPVVDRRAREARFLQLVSIRQPLTELVGRRDEMAALVELIPGAVGCGKTRLVIEVALEPSGRFADGAAYVGLSAVDDLALVAEEVARALGVAQQNVDKAQTAYGDVGPRVTGSSCVAVGRNATRGRRFPVSRTTSASMSVSSTG